jgi:hypothetical protein
MSIIELTAGNVSDARAWAEAYHEGARASYPYDFVVRSTQLLVECCIRQNDLRSARRLCQQMLRENAGIPARRTVCLQANAELATLAMAQTTTPLQAYVAQYQRRFPVNPNPPTLDEYATPQRFDQLALGPNFDQRVQNINSEALAWGHSYSMMALNEMYRVTGDTKYLDAMRKYAKSVIALRDDKRGNKLWTGEPSTVWSTSRYNRRGRTAFGVHTGIIIYPVLDFLILAEGNKDYKARWARSLTKL